MCMSLCWNTHIHIWKNKTGFFCFFSKGSLEWMLWDSTVSMATTAHLLPLVGCLCMCACVCRVIYLHHYALKYLILHVYHVKTCVCRFCVPVLKSTAASSLWWMGVVVLLVADQKEPEPTWRHLPSSSLPLEGTDVNKWISVLKKKEQTNIRTSIKHDSELDMFGNSELARSKDWSDATLLQKELLMARRDKARGRKPGRSR